MCISSDSFVIKASVPQPFHGKATKAMLEICVLMDAAYTMVHDDFIKAVHLAQCRANNFSPDSGLKLLFGMWLNCV